MEFIDKLAEKVSEGTKALSKKTDEFLEITEFRMEIKKLEEEMMDLKIFIGEMVYKNYLGTPVDPSELTEQCKEIEAIYKKINAVKKQMNRIKGIQVCNHCGEEVDFHTNYCSYCGAKMNIDKSGKI